MLIASSEGQGWRYEVLVQSDGFLVQARDLDSGQVSLEDTILFRTSPAALAYADMTAAADRFAASRLAGAEDCQDLAEDYHHELGRFTAIRDRLFDEGIVGELLNRRHGASRRHSIPRLH